MQFTIFEIFFLQLVSQDFRVFQIHRIANPIRMKYTMSPTEKGMLPNTIRSALETTGYNPLLYHCSTVFGKRPITLTKMI
jgi:hypothetical protein